MSGMVLMTVLVWQSSIRISGYKQLADQFFDGVVAAFAERGVAQRSRRLNQVFRGPIQVLVVHPRGVIVVECARVIYM
ncbi:hypothetical protein MLPF_0380 [Mycobacterium lepromatosis]|nr:hypothetical protein MLPF_0380 [Mycobacterium lepromatosis]